MGLFSRKKPKEHIEKEDLPSTDDFLKSEIIAYRYPITDLPVVEIFLRICTDISNSTKGISGGNYDFGVKNFSGYVLNVEFKDHQHNVPSMYSIEDMDNMLFSLEHILNDAITNVKSFKIFPSPNKDKLSCIYETRFPDFSGAREILSRVNQEIHDALVAQPSISKDVIIKYHNLPNKS